MLNYPLYSKNKSSGMTTLVDITKIDEILAHLHESHIFTSICEKWILPYKV